MIILVLTNAKDEWSNTSYDNFELKCEFDLQNYSKKEILSYNLEIFKSL